MPGGQHKSLMRRTLEGAIRKAFTRAYQTIKVDPEKYMQHLRMAYGLPAIGHNGMYSVELHVLDHIAEETIRASMKMAAAEGAGLGMGGMFTILKVREGLTSYEDPGWYRYPQGTSATKVSG